MRTMDLIEYAEEVRRLAREGGLAFLYEGGSDSEWAEYLANGYTPEEALIEDLSHAE